MRQGFVLLACLLSKGSSRLARLPLQNHPRKRGGDGSHPATLSEFGFQFRRKDDEFALRDRSDQASGSAMRPPRFKGWHRGWL